MNITNYKDDHKNHFGLLAFIMPADYRFDRFSAFHKMLSAVFFS